MNISITANHADIRFLVKAIEGHNPPADASELEKIIHNERRHSLRNVFVEYVLSKDIVASLFKAGNCGDDPKRIREAIRIAIEQIGELPEIKKEETKADDSLPEGWQIEAYGKNGYISEGKEMAGSFRVNSKGKAHSLFVFGGFEIPISIALHLMSKEFPIPVEPAAIPLPAATMPATEAGDPATDGIPAGAITSKPEDATGAAAMLSLPSGPEVDFDSVSPSEGKAESDPSSDPDIIRLGSDLG